MSVFASDQYKPSICYEEPEQTDGSPPALGSGADQPSAPSKPKVMELNKHLVIEPNPLVDWRTPYLDYLLCEALSTNKMEAQRLTRRAKSFVLIKDKLYKRSHTGILQHCIPIK